MDAIGYATARAKFGRCEIRVLNKAGDVAETLRFDYQRRAWIVISGNSLYFGEASMIFGKLAQCFFEAPMIFGELPQYFLEPPRYFSELPQYFLRATMIFGRV
jgi:hypothetical protein